MAIREILCYPDERLKRQSVDVDQFDDALQSLIADLEQTMRAGPGGGRDCRASDRYAATGGVG